MADNTKKQIPLRLSSKLYDAIAAWAEDDFRSVNGQIEYLLTECVRQRKKNGAPVPHELDVPPEYIKAGNCQISSHCVFISYNPIPGLPFYQLFKCSRIYLIL